MCSWSRLVFTFLPSFPRVQAFKSYIEDPATMLL